MSALKTRDGSPQEHRTLIDLLLTRFQFLGNAADLAAASWTADRFVNRFSTHPDSHLARAAVRSALHDFDGALEHLRAAEESGASASRTGALRETIALATGHDLRDVLAGRQLTAARTPRFDTYFRLAAVEAELGMFEEADAHYQMALEHYTDTSPFAFAAVAFQRGVMWAEMADEPRRAVSHYREALARFPLYTVAVVHLAELEALFGQPEKAIERLKGVLSTTTDPEPAGLLAELFALRHETSSSAEFAEQARRRYAELLSRFDRAYLDHAAEFFMGAGSDPKKAETLALNNLETRKNARAYLVAIEATLAAGSQEGACSLARDALKIESGNRLLKRLATRTLRKCPEYIAGREIALTTGYL